MSFRLSQEVSKMANSESCACKESRQLIQKSLHDDLPSGVFLSYSFYQEFPVRIIQSLLCHVIVVSYRCLRIRTLNLISEYFQNCIYCFKSSASLHLLVLLSYVNCYLYCSFPMLFVCKWICVFTLL